MNQAEALRAIVKWLETAKVKAIWKRALSEAEGAR